MTAHSAATGDTLPEHLDALARHGYARKLWDGYCRGNTRHGLAVYARRAQREQLLAAAPEHEGVPTLEPHDQGVLLRLFN